MSVELCNEYDGGIIPAEFDFDIYETAENAVECTLDLEKCGYECHVDILLTGSEEVHTINRDTRGIDKTTDVLSFPMTAYPDVSDTDFDPDSGELFLGDVVLNLDRVMSQAKEYGHSMRREYAFLIVHSVLHLLGYDHMTESEASDMETRQRNVLDKLGIKR